MRKRLPIGLLLVLGLALAGCGPSGTVEEQVAAQLEAMEAAGEAGERGSFMGFVADGFQAQDGAMTREDFRRYLFLQFNDRRRIKAQRFPMTITVQGPNLATADFNVLITGGGGLIPDDGQLFAVQTEWVLEGGDWLLWRADWQGITP